MLNIDQLNLVYGQRHILNNLNLQLAPGIHALIGKSGSGKTSLLRCLAGLEQYSGTINGIDPKQLGLIEQPMTLFPHLTIQENVAYPLKLRRYLQTKIASKVANILRHCQISLLAKRYPHQVSGGEQRRAMVARTLVYAPTVLLCDEPFSALDAITRYELVNWFKTFIPESCTVLYVTHDLAEAKYLSQHILILEAGQLVADSPLLHSHF